MRRTALTMRYRGPNLELHEQRSFRHHSPLNNNCALCIVLLVAHALQYPNSFDPNLVLPSAVENLTIASVTRIWRMDRGNSSWQPRLYRHKALP